MFCPLPLGRGETCVSALAVLCLETFTALTLDAVPPSLGRVCLANWECFDSWLEVC